MEPEAWIAAFAAEVGAEPPSPEDIDRMLKLAAVAAHSSERIAAPVACWIAGSRGLDLDRAREIAETINPGEGD
jgi:predicted methyltransferase MtxX (methanogen marker protein 4)